MGKTKQKPLKRDDLVSASEIGQYNYCSLSWYLQRCGFKPDSPSLKIGKNAHIELGGTVDSIQIHNRRAKYATILGYLLLSFAAIIILFGVVL